MTEMTSSRVRALLASYGSDPARWPREERRAAERLLAADPDLAAEVAEARAVDAMLDALPALAPSPGLRVVLKEIPEADSRGWAGRLAALWPFGTPWRPAAGLAAAAMLGILVGIATSEPTTADSQVAMTFIYDDDPVAYATAMASGAGYLEPLP